MRHFPSPLSANADSWVEYLQHNTSWVPLGNRYKAWCTDCSCPYMYSGNNISPQPILPGLKELGRFVAACAHKPIPNCANLNLYRDGRDACGWHSDEEAIFNLLYEPGDILSVSFGSDRTFQVRLKSSTDSAFKSITLSDGDVCAMEGMFQRVFEHRIPRESACSNPRLNITFRTHVAHASHCPLNCLLYTSDAADE